MGLEVEYNVGESRYIIQKFSRISMPFETLTNKEVDKLARNVHRTARLPNFDDFGAKVDIFFN